MKETGSSRHKVLLEPERGRKAGVGAEMELGQKGPPGSDARRSNSGNATITDLPGHRGLGATGPEHTPSWGAQSGTWRHQHFFLGVKSQAERLKRPPVLALRCDELRRKGRWLRAELKTQNEGVSDGRPGTSTRSQSQTFCIGNWVKTCYFPEWRPHPKLSMAPQM